jgi:hypothetical protein
MINLVKRFAQGVFHFGRKFVNVDSRTRDSLFLEVLLQNHKTPFHSKEFCYGIFCLYVLLRNCLELVFHVQTNHFLSRRKKIKEIGLGHSYQRRELVKEKISLFFVNQFGSFVFDLQEIYLEFSLGFLQNKAK